MSTRTLLTALLVTAALGLAACASSQPTRFFLLQPAATSPAQHPEPATEPGRVLGIGPVELPRYLDRPQIVTRGTGHRLEVAEFARWGEPLRDNLTRVLAQNLALQLPADRIERFPWARSGSIDYQVTLEITRFEGIEGAESVLSAHWQIRDPASGETLMARTSNLRATPQTPDHAGTVAALNQVLDALSREIGAALRSSKTSAEPDQVVGSLEP